MEIFDTKERLERQLLLDLIRSVNEAINKYSEARVLLSGGSTPQSLYKKFAQSDIDWARIHIGLVDDRVVSIDDDFSNEKMIRDIFYTANVDLVNIYGLVKREPQLGEIKNKYSIFQERIDYTILGMGNDGHTASLCPHDPISESILNSNKKSIDYTTAPVYPTKRVTCSKGLIKSSKNIALMILGSDKKLILEQSYSDRKPITYFLEECPQMKTYYSPA